MSSRCAWLDSIHRCGHCVLHRRRKINLHQVRACALRRAARRRRIKLGSVLLPRRLCQSVEFAQSSVGWRVSLCVLFVQAAAQEGVEAAREVQARRFHPPAHACLQYAVAPSYRCTGRFHAEGKRQSMPLCAFSLETEGRTVCQPQRSVAPTKACIRPCGARVITCAHHRVGVTFLSGLRAKMVRSAPVPTARSAYRQQPAGPKSWPPLRSTTRPTQKPKPKPKRPYDSRTTWPRRPSCVYSPPWAGLVGYVVSNHK